MRKRILVIVGGALMLAAAYLAGAHNSNVVHAQSDMPGMANSVPKSYGRLVTAIADSIGTGLVFEDSEGVIRFVSITGMKEGQLERYEGTPTHGGIPKSYGHLVSVVVNNGNTGLIFEDDNGVIRFVTLAGKMENELARE